MITTALVTAILNIISGLTSGLQDLTFTVSDGFYQVIENYLCCALYFIPFNDLTPIAVFVVSMFGFRAVVSLIKTIWDLLPIL